MQLCRVCVHGGNEDVHQLSQQGGAVGSEMHFVKAKTVPFHWHIQISGAGHHLVNF